MLRKSFLAIIAGLTISICTAQSGNTPEDIGPSSYEVSLIPESPQVASLGTYGGYPVNQYNGTANISIPIHSIDLDGLMIPFTLSYNTGGIRVNQDATWVGLGWNLSEGIVITREINGYDDLRNGDYSADADNIGWIHTEDYLTPNANNGYSFSLSGSTLLYLDTEFTINQPHDFEPDLFTVSTPNGSCKFYLPKRQGNENMLVAKTVDSNNFKVKFFISQFEDQEDYSFEVIDPKGFKYIFNYKEKSTGYSSWDAPPGTIFEAAALDGIPYWSTNQTRDLITAWKPETIISPYDNTLNFEYTPGHHFSYPSFSETFSFNINAQANTATAYNEELTVINPTSLSASLNAFHNLYLSKVTGDFGSLEFNLGSERLDLFSKTAFRNLSNLSAWNPSISPNTKNAKRLESVILKDFQGNQVKQVDMTYSYFNSNKINDTNKENYLRLKLDEVQIFDQKYSFNYINQNSLPTKDSKATDLWGFYNGVNSNTHRIPSSNRFYYIFSSNIAGGTREYEKFYKINGANRKSDSIYSKYGLLERVTYPTGGSTEYHYEGNEVTLQRVGYQPTYYSDTGEFRTPGIRSSEEYNFAYQHLKLQEDPSYTLYDYNDCQVGNYSVGINSNIDITDTNFCNNQSFNVKVTYQISCVTGCNQGINPVGPAVWVENVNTGQVYPLINYDNQFDVNTLSVSDEQEMSLPVGTYVLRTQSWSNSSPLVVANATASMQYWKDESPTSDHFDTFQVGGLRVKKTVNKDTDGSFISAKTYDYTTTGESGTITSSGKLMDDLVFTSKGSGSMWEYTPENYGSDGNNKAQIHSENRIRTANSASGSHIGYSVVTEKSVDSNGNDNGWITTTFKNHPNKRLTRNILCTPQFVGASGSSTCQEDYSCISTSSGCSGFSGFLFQELYYGEVYLLGTSPVTYDYINGSMEMQTVHHKDGTLLQKTMNEYIPYSLNVNLVQSFPIMNFFDKKFPIGHPYQVMDLDAYEQSTFMKLSHTTIENFFDQGSMVSESKYYYESPNYFLKRMEMEDSEGNLRTTIAEYPQDLTSESLMNTLVTNNRLAEQVRSEIYIGTEANPMQTKLSEQYTVFGNGVDYGYHIIPKEIWTKKADYDAELRQIYELYDVKGNILQYKKPGGSSTSFIWGYNDQFPIAKIENASYEDIRIALNKSNISEVINLTELEMDDINELRNSLPQAMITTYEYLPFIGITKTTDARGYTTHYEYDGNNRLQFVRDNDGFLLSENQYNYKD
ncbi:RHS repeat domain-containing protein [Aureicoccus marinus]|uniref:YD repeat-containing protein n=1 Tax=Aureicoccus marinus TaxID=754435 RepID=A0A2S7T730_9FLAO|nr:RHS repeat domain-containing protein [Aureicoccus marinus]PQJ15315.1 hypothetical protein BST99_05805 [Aureicoccus marinus]